MPNKLQKIVKLTQAQYDILEAGGTVGSYTGLDPNYIYHVEDTNEYITTLGGQRIQDALTIADIRISGDTLSMEYNTNSFIDVAILGYAIYGEDDVGGVLILPGHLLIYGDHDNSDANKPSYPDEWLDDEDNPLDIDITLYNTGFYISNPDPDEDVYLNFPTHSGTFALVEDLADYQPKDANLTAIAGLSGTSGFLKKTAANTWSLDTNTYALSTHNHDGVYVKPADLATVATSGDYDDLINKPTIPVVNYPVIDVRVGNTSAVTNKIAILGTLAGKSSLLESDIPSLSASKIISGTFDIARIPTIPTDNISGLAAVATTGSYTDLINKPTIPSVSLTTTAGSEAIIVGSDTLNVVTRDTAQTISGIKTFPINIPLKFDIGSGYEWQVNSGNGSRLYLQRYSSGRLQGGISLSTENVRPTGDMKYLGSSDTPWTDLYLSGSSYFGGTNVSLTKDPNDNRLFVNINGNAKAKFGRSSTIFATSVNPDANNTYDLGSGSLYWRNLQLSGNLTDGTNSITIANIASKSDIPTVNNASHIIQLNGTTIGTNFTANASSNIVTNIQALPNYSLRISTSLGIPREVKFVRVNYTNFTLDHGAYFKIGAMCCHENGKSYTFLEDIIIGVDMIGSVTCTVYKQVQNASTVVVDGHTVHYGDVYWVVDTENKYIDFYIICGQYSTINFTPFIALGLTSNDTSEIVQQTGSAILYSSGTKVWNASGNGSLYAKTSDIPSTYIKLASVNNNTLTLTKQDGTNITYTPSFTDNDHYPTTFSWTNGTTSGPTGSLTGNSGFSAVSFGAIPSASTSQSGIITTSDQSFSGQKTFVKTTGDGVPIILEYDNDVNYALIINEANSRHKIRFDISGSLSEDIDIQFPNVSGILALQSDIPTVNNATLTIQKNGATISTFTANASSNVTANITVPTKVTDLTDAGNYLNTGVTEQTKTGNLFLKGNLYIGSGIPANGDGSTVYFAKDVRTDRRSGAFSGFYANSSQWNRFYGLAYNAKYICKCTYSGYNGSDLVSTAADGLWECDRNYSIPAGTSEYLACLFDSNFTTGAVFPTTGLTTRPVVITITTADGTSIDATDTNYIMLNGWRYAGDPESSYGYYGKLTGYKVELLLKNVNTNALEWVTTFERTNVSDPITNICIPIWSHSKVGSAVSNYEPSNSSNYKQFYGIRLTISGAIAGTVGANKFGITEFKLMETRPAGAPADGVGALPLMGGKLYGNLTLTSKYNDMFIRPESNKTGNLGTASLMWKGIYGENIYENGVSLSDKYLSKAEYIIQVAYPIGSIYMSVNSTNPGDIFGGTWERLEGMFLLGATGNTVSTETNIQNNAVVGPGGKGGEATHTLSEGEMPAHSHDGVVRDCAYTSQSCADGSGDKSVRSGVAWNNMHVDTEVKGSGLSHNNMPPFLAVYMWKRIA